MRDKLKGIDSDDLIYELERRCDMPDPEIEYETELVEVEVEKPILDLRRHLCDICELGYHSNTEEIIIKIKERI